MPRITFNFVECNLTSWYLPSTLQNSQGRGPERGITRSILKQPERKHIFACVTWLLVDSEVVKKSLFDVFASETRTRCKAGVRKHTASCYLQQPDLETAQVPVSR